MEANYQILLSPEQKNSLLEQSDNFSILLETLIHDNAEKLAYILQEYHPREKVSMVSIVKDSINLKAGFSATLRIQYVLEEYNACRAIDTEQWERMTLQATANIDQGILTFKGENWPEL